MDRGEEIYNFVRKLTDALSLSHHNLCDAVQETLDWLRTSPDYRSYIEATVPNDFSLLPNEIIHDVVNSHGEKRGDAYDDLENLVQIEGSWGMFARALSACTTQDYYLSNVVFLSREHDCAAGSSREKEISFEKAVNRDICVSFIDGGFELDRLTAIAPKLYDDIYFFKLLDRHCKALDLMGTRFSTIRWRGGDEEQPATAELVHFLRRQLQSNYLTELDVSGVKFEDGAFDKELVVFVTRPWFDRLDMEKALCRVPFEVIEGAHKAWKAPKCYLLKKQEIKAQISKKTLRKIEKYFKKKFEFKNGNSQMNIPHPEDAKDESNANFCLRIDKVNDYYWIRMDICDL